MGRKTAAATGFYGLSPRSAPGRGGKGCDTRAVTHGLRGAERGQAAGTEPPPFLPAATPLREGVPALGFHPTCGTARPSRLRTLTDVKHRQQQGAPETSPAGFDLPSSPSKISIQRLQRNSGGEKGISAIPQIREVSRVLSA